MKLAEYLDDCKKKLGVTTSYQLAKHIDIPTNKLSEYYAGKHLPDDYVLFQIAELLQIDPAIVIAEVRSEMEKNPKKREYFKVFRGACGKAAAGIILGLALSISLLSVSGDGGHRLTGSVVVAIAATAFLRFRYCA